jgi:hypothetical protein
MALGADHAYRGGDPHNLRLRTIGRRPPIQSLGVRDYGGAAMMAYFRFVFVAS